jgi:hypothetical protein
MKKTKRTVPVPMYVGDTEKYFPAFKKIVNKGDLVVEMPLNEAKARRDFIVINKEE